MESPFYPRGGTNSCVFTLFVEPILDSYTQTYLNVITLSTMPTGPLADMVRMISLPKLSPFMSVGSNSGISNNGLGLGCTYVLMKYPVRNAGGGVPKSTDGYMRPDDIPAVFSYLTSHGYTIDSGLTTMMNRSRVLIGGVSETRFSGDRKMICMVTYST
jgi:hypothetical protein